ncbi:GtrA family protein [Intrasporangium sp. YIM S08009]|uniref:GtrA family protein n=1 Tax=Intrasporangium zincisolvens TaxID=3080018 RepID=UPI002B053D83|nr:GtrA family protein [Intrasporangium sp. YIM S08009]
MGTIGRFLVAGGGNTLLTAGVTSLVALMAPVGLAYSIGYAAGLALSVVTASRFVFRRRLTMRRAAGVCAVNLLAFMCGFAALTLAHGLGLPEGLSGLTVLVTAPVSFLGAAAVFRDAPEAGDSPGPAIPANLTEMSGLQP